MFLGAREKQATIWYPRIGGGAAPTLALQNTADSLHFGYAAVR